MDIYMTIVCFFCKKTHNIPKEPGYDDTSLSWIPSFWNEETNKEEASCCPDCLHNLVEEPINSGEWLLKKK